MLSANRLSHCWGSRIHPHLPVAQETTEPLPRDHPLVSLSNVVLTPHVGYVTQESFRAYYMQAKEDVDAWLAGKPIRVLKGEDAHSKAEA